MASVNKVILIGNLGADPELRYTQGGSSVANLRLATQESWKDRDGNRQEKTEWHSITVWGAQADSVAQYKTKGDPLYIEGRLQTREYDDRDGNRRKITEIVASQVVFLSGGKSSGGKSSGGGARQGGSGTSHRPPTRRGEQPSLPNPCLAPPPELLPPELFRLLTAPCRGAAEAAPNGDNGDDGPIPF